MLGDMISVSAREDPLESKPNYFELETCMGRVYEMAADNQSQMLDWLDFLRVMIDVKNTTKGCLTSHFRFSDFQFHFLPSKSLFFSFSLSLFPSFPFLFSNPIAFSSENFDLQSCEMYGNLKKRVDSQKQARTRWFLLKGKTIYFFKSFEERVTQHDQKFVCSFEC